MHIRAITAIMLALLTSLSLLGSSSVLVGGQQEEKKRIEVVKHIVKDSNITEDDIMAWLMEANHIWGCSFVFVQVDTYYHDGYDSSHNIACKVNIWAVPDVVEATGDPNLHPDISAAEVGGTVVWLTDGDCANIHIKDSTLGHELGHTFGLPHNETDPTNLMYPDNDGEPPTSCHRTGTTVTEAQQNSVRENARRFQAKEAGQGQDVHDAVGNPIDAFMDITWAEGWAEYATTTWTLHLTLTVVSFTNVSYWLGFLIESDSNMATGEPVEGIDYIVSFNPSNNLVNFSRYDIGWTPLDPTGIIHEFTYRWQDLDAPPIINGISFSFPLTKLDRRAGNIISVRAVTYNETHIDQAPNTGFLSVGNLSLAWSTDSAGNSKSTFNMSDNVYVRGQDFPADTNVAIHLIPDGAEALPANAVANASTTTNSTGGLPVTLVWSQPLTLGEYDIWVDVNQNGVFDGGDVWNSQSIGIYGLDVIPEFPTWTSVLLILIVLTVAIAIYKRRLLKAPIH